jgi:hypothetical protein
MLAGNRHLRPLFQSAPRRARNAGLSGYQSGGAAAWMPSSSLQGGINSVPWQALLRAYRSDKRATGYTQDTSLFARCFRSRSKNDEAVVTSQHIEENPHRISAKFCEKRRNFFLGKIAVLTRSVCVGSPLVLTNDAQAFAARADWSYLDRREVARSGKFLFA